MNSVINHLRAMLALKLAFDAWIGKPVHVGNNQYDTLNLISLNDQDELVFQCGTGTCLNLDQFADYNQLKTILNQIIGEK